MVEREKPSESPSHSVEPKGRRPEDRADHEVDAPKERVDDEVGGEEKKRTQRQE